MALPNGVARRLAAWALYPLTAAPPIEKVCVNQGQVSAMFPLRYPLVEVIIGRNNL